MYYTEAISKEDLNAATNDSSVSDDSCILNSCDSSVNSLRNRGGCRISGRTSSDVSSEDWKGRAMSESPVWCMDFCNDLIILGCADGRLEFWEASTGKLLVS